MTDKGVLHYSAEIGDESSLAALFDVVRDLLVEALDRGDRVERLVVDSNLHEVMAATKARELARGRSLTVLGLEVWPAQAGLPGTASERARGGE